MSKAWQVYAKGPSTERLRHFTVAADDEAEARALVESCDGNPVITDCSELHSGALALLEITRPKVLEWKPMNEVTVPHVVKRRPKG